MDPKFEVIFLEQAINFMSKIDAKSKKKIYYNIDKAKLANDPELFKKLEGKIWDRKAAPEVIQNKIYWTSVKASCFLGQNR